MTGGLFMMSCERLQTYYTCPDDRLGLPWDVIGDEADNDCNGVVDDTDPSLLDHRAHCGTPHEPCTLEPGFRDVRCIDGQCVPQEEGPGGVGNERGLECHDGIDNDQDGVIDNGPDCEVLIANAATPECRGGDPMDPRCPPVSFLMGSNRNEARDYEKPESLVMMNYDYLIDRHEVTQPTFRRFLCESRIGGSPEDIERCLDATSIPDPAIDGRVWEFPQGNEEHPVSGVSWCEASQYCAWAGKRLPFEVEWERMARGTQNLSDPYPWHRGTANPFAPACLRYDVPEICRLGAVTADCCRGMGSVMLPGGFARIGRQDIQHVGGQVSEWVYDPFVGPYGFANTAYPMNPSALAADMSKGSTHVLRGGGYRQHGEYMITSRREIRSFGRRRDSSGIRCARTFGAASPDLDFQYVPATMECEHTDEHSVVPARGEIYMATRIDYDPSSKISVVADYLNRDIEVCRTRLVLIKDSQNDGEMLWSMGTISEFQSDYHIYADYAQGFRRTMLTIDSEHQVLTPVDTDRI